MLTVRQLAARLQEILDNSPRHTGFPVDGHFDRNGTHEYRAHLPSGRGGHTDRGRKARGRVHVPHGRIRMKIKDRAVALLREFVQRHDSRNMYEQRELTTILAEAREVLFRLDHEDTPEHRREANSPT